MDEKVVSKMFRNLLIGDVGREDGKLYCLTRDRCAAVIIHNPPENIEGEFEELSKYTMERLRKVSDTSEYKIKVPIDRVRHFLDFIKKLWCDVFSIETNGEKVILKATEWEDRVEYQIETGNNGVESKKFGLYTASFVRDFLRSFKITDLRVYDSFLKFKEMEDGHHILIIELQLAGAPICEFFLAPRISP